MGPQTFTDVDGAIKIPAGAAPLHAGLLVGAEASCNRLLDIQDAVDHSVVDDNGCSVLMYALNHASAALHIGTIGQIPHASYHVLIV